MADLIAIGNYTIRYDKPKNQIIVGLPQTYSTVRNTVNPIEDRKVDVTDKELTFLLMMVRHVFMPKGKAVENDD